MSTPRDTATAHDTIKIGGVLTPGLCSVSTVAYRKTKYDIQGQPGYIGDIAVPNGQELIKRTYRFLMWTVEHFAQWEVLQQRLEAARSRKPKAEALSVEDPRLRGLDVTAFVVEGYSEEIDAGPGRWAREVMLIEFGTRIKIQRLPANQAVQDDLKDKSDAAKARRAASKGRATGRVGIVRGKLETVRGQIGQPT